MNAEDIRIKEAIEALRPIYTSPRLVRLAAQLGVLAACRPHQVAAVEQLVETLLEKRRPVRMTEVPGGAHRKPAG